jgi:hypothetical protein
MKRLLFLRFRVNINDDDNDDKITKKHNNLNGLLRLIIKTLPNSYYSETEQLNYQLLR